VTAIENEDILASTASHNLQKLQLSNVKVTISPLAEGDEKSAPFDVICIAGGAEVIPQALQAQLREGGRIVWVKVNPDSRAMGWVCVGVKNGGVISHREMFDTQWRCLPALTQPKNFTF
jgi:protein-L-isoaspartate(D-aspartate) O-methyltransferase